MTTFEHNGCQWYVNDTRGYLDAGPACDECGACECERCDDCIRPVCCSADATEFQCKAGEVSHNGECIGLSVAYVCLDGGDALCAACAEKEGLPICA